MNNNIEIFNVKNKNNMESIKMSSNLCVFFLRKDTKHILMFCLKAIYTRICVME